MKIHNDVPGINAGFYLLRRSDGRAWRLKLQALPFGYPEQVAADLPGPTPPVEFVKDSKGRVLRDEDGRALTTYRRYDPAYLAECRRIDQLRTVHAVYTALKADTEIVFTSAAAGKPFRRFVESLEQEFKDAGFSDEELLLISNKIAALNAGQSDRTEAAAQSFLLEEPSAAAGASPTEQDEPAST